MGKIYIFNNGGAPNHYHALAMAESGHVIAGHICSHEGFMSGDMGLTSEWKHKEYKEHYPDGFELEWVPTDQLDSHAGLNAAIAKNKELNNEEKSKNQPSATIEFDDGSKCEIAI